MNTQKLIDGYLAGNLTDQQQDEFNKLLEQNEAFRQEYEFHNNLKATVEAHEKKNLENLVTEIESKYKKRPFSFKKILVISLFALIFIMLFIFVRNNAFVKNTPQEIFAEYYETYPNTYHPVTRGSADALSKAFLAYESGNYELAVKSFEEMPAKTSEMGLAFYQAMALSESNRFAEAIVILDSVKDYPSSYQVEAYWYLGLLYLAEDKSDLAKNNFQAFSSLFSDHPLSQKSKEIQSKLD